jgi:hypothetical protein
MIKRLSALLLLASSQSLIAEPYPGVPTRAQNPLLQAYFIPAMPISGEHDWSLSHSLYITNTYHIESNGSESLILDVENKRYDLQATYRHQLWHFNVNLSLIDNDKGFLDQTINSWHDLFGFPQGGRDDRQNDLIEFFYQQDGTSIIDSQQADSGLADLQLALGYQLTPASQLWFGIELPSGDDNPLLSNDAVDLAFWYSAHTAVENKLQSYGLAGVAFPANDGLFKDRIESQILFAQLGVNYAWLPDWQFFFQADFHSRMVKDASVEALDHSLQGQFGLRLPRLTEHYQLDLFFSEDILPGHAPDITFALRVSPRQ